MNSTLLRNLGLREAVALVMGTIIGTGVFLKGATMAQLAGSESAVLLAWAIAGALSLVGALCYAELTSQFPEAGGAYVFLREAFGDAPAFLYGWMRFWIGGPGSIAAYAVGSATFLSGVLNLRAGVERTLVAGAAIVAFTAINCVSVNAGGRAQSALTVMKCALVVGLAGSLLACGSQPLIRGAEAARGLAGTWTSFGGAIIAALWAYDGWDNMPMAAGEIRDPVRNIPRALGFGMLGVIFFYLILNLSFFRALPIHAVAGANSQLYPDAPALATVAASRVFGEWSAGFLAVAFAISAVGALNGSVLTSARVPFAMAKDGLFFSALARVTKKRRSPVISLVVQAAIAMALAASGTFDQLTDAVVLCAWVFYMLSMIALFKLRRRATFDAYRAPWYPWLPCVFLAGGAALIGNQIWRAPIASGLGIAFILSGLPVFAVFRRSLRRLNP